MENWFFMVALILWSISANWLSGGNSKIEKKWGRGQAVGRRHLGDSRASAGSGDVGPGPVQVAGGA